MYQLWQTSAPSLASLLLSTKEIVGVELLALSLTGLQNFVCLIHDYKSEDGKMTG